MDSAAGCAGNVDSELAQRRTSRCRYRKRAGLRRRVGDVYRCGIESGSCAGRHSGGAQIHRSGKTCRRRNGDVELGTPARCCCDQRRCNANIKIWCRWKTGQQLQRFCKCNHLKCCHRYSPDYPQCRRSRLNIGGGRSQLRSNWPCSVGPVLFAAVCSMY